MVKRLRPAQQLNPRPMVRGFLVVLATVILATVATTYSSQLARAFTLATTHLPEGYTQLYFVDQAHLPEHVKTATPTSFSFDITNAEGEAQTYSYEVTQVAPDGMVSYIGDGNVTLQDGASIVVPITFELKAANSSAQLRVSLIGANGQEIDFRSQT